MLSKTHLNLNLAKRLCEQTNYWTKRFKSSGEAHNPLNDCIDGYLPYPKGFSSLTIHAFQDPDSWTDKGVIQPLVLASTFKQDSAEKLGKYQYARIGNPNRDRLEHILACMEGGKNGYCFSSGMAAIGSVMTCLPVGTHVICNDDIYGGTFKLMKEVMNRYCFEMTSIDTAERPEDLENAIKENTRLIWVETPTNPTLKVTDIKKVADIAHKHNILLAIDNTFLSPYLQRPFTMGADLVAHSVTKYLNGHSDLLMGAVITNHEQFDKELKFIQAAYGSVPSPFDCYMVARSLKTLPLRIQQHYYNGITVAKFLEGHPKIEKVLHPGLPSHPQHELSKKQTSGHSGVFSFYAKGSLHACAKLMSDLKYFPLAVSLGGVESLIEMPILQTHANVPEEGRKRLKITDNLIRLSVGIEDVEDLICDLDQALDKL